MEPEVVNLRVTVPALAEAIVSDLVRQSGVITKVTIHFPPGCAALVDVAVRVKNEQLVPASGFIALDDVTTPFVVNKPVRQEDEVSARIRNGDGANPHTISVILENTPPSETS